MRNSEFYFDAIDHTIQMKIPEIYLSGNKNILNFPEFEDLAKQNNFSTL